MTRAFDPALLKVLACPVSRGPLRWDAAAQELISDDAGLAYPVREGIPVLVAEDARPIR